MTGETQNAIALLVGIAALRLGLTDAHLRYVKPALGPWLVVAGVLLLILGAVGLVRRDRPAAEQAAELLHDGETHAPDHGPSIAWLLTLPVLAIFLIAPAPLGAYAASRSTTRLEAPKAEFPSLPKQVDGAVPLSLREFNLRTFFDDSRALDGKVVRLTGFATPHGKDEVFLTRFVLSCCAADGRPIKVRLIGLPSPRPPADQWLEVEGTWVPPKQDRQGEALLGLAADLVVKSVREIAAPAQTYEA